MSTKLCIQVSSALQPKKLEVEFVYNVEWTSDTELMLLQKVREVLAIAREDGLSLKLNMEITVNEPEHLFALLNKKLHEANNLTIKNHKLTIREIEILGLIMQGHTNCEIADKLFISYETVKSHRKNILAKTGAPNTAALISYYNQTFFEK